MDELEVDITVSRDPVVSHLADSVVMLLEATRSLDHGVDRCRSLVLVTSVSPHVLLACRVRDHAVDGSGLLSRTDKRAEGILYVAYWVISYGYFPSSPLPQYRHDCLSRLVSRVNRTLARHTIVYHLSIDSILPCLSQSTVYFQ